MATPRAAHSTARRGALAKLRAYFLPRVLDSFKVVSAFQAACGVKDGVATNRLLHAIFTFGAALGNEITFILFLPYLFWEYDIVVARRLIILWGALYYIGQSLKDMLQLPRPGPPAVQLETHYAAEYGLPSTHAMNSCSMPWFIVLESWDRVSQPSDKGLLLAIALVWTVSCCLSRLYMGVHSPWDVAVGAALGVLATGALYSVVLPLDTALMHSSLAPLVIVALGVGLTYAYPRPAKWVNSPGDCATILGVCIGVTLGAYFSHDPASVFTTAPIVVPAGMPLLLSLPKCLCGFVVLFLVRAVFQPVSLSILAAIFPSPDPTVIPKRRYTTELPAKLITYTAVGFHAVYVVPLLYKLAGY